MTRNQIYIGIAIAAAVGGYFLFKRYQANKAREIGDSKFAHANTEPRGEVVP